MPPTSKPGDMEFIMLWLALLLALPLALLAFLVLPTVLKRRRWLKSRGYWARPYARDDVRYEEARGSTIEHIDIPGEVRSPGPSVIYAKSDERWNSEAPGWAQGRRDEILKRVKELMGREIERWD